MASAAGGTSQRLKPACAIICCLSSKPLGVVCATTLVHRAPDERFKALVPYRLVLVDMQDGMRVMGHALASLQIGDQVHCEIHTLAGQPLPFFTRTDHEA